MIRGSSALAIALLVGLASAYSNQVAVVPQRASHFVGREVRHQSNDDNNAGQATTTTTRRRSQMSMKKGKPNLPVQMRSQYARSKEMESYRRQMMEAQMAGPDGLPVFNLFVRTSLKNMWYPCGSFKGDEKSQALCQSYRDGGLLSGISKKQLDAGVGGSLYRDLDRLEETIVRGYPQLRKDKGKLEYGYKLNFEGLSKDQEKITVVEIKEQKGFMDGLKNIFSGN